MAGRRHAVHTSLPRTRYTWELDEESNMWVVEAFDEDGEYVAYSQEAYVSEADAQRAAAQRAAEQPEYDWEVRYVEKHTADPERPYAEV